MLKSLRVIAEKTGKTFEYDIILEEIKTNAKTTFYNAGKGAYSFTENGENFTVLGNTLALLSGIADNQKTLCKKFVMERFYKPKIWIRY